MHWRCKYFYFSSVPPVALAVPKLFFRDTGWKQFSQAPVMAEEVVEEHRGVIVEELETDEIIEYHREVIERDFVEDEVIREPVYRYFSYNVPDRSHGTYYFSIKPLIKK